MANSSSCNKCGAKLVPGADICDLCGTLISTDGASVPDWIDVVDQVVPAYRTIPDPVRPDVPGTNLAGTSVAPGAASEPESDLHDSDTSRHPADESDPVEIVPEEDFFDAAEEISESAQESAPSIESVQDSERVAVVEEENFFSSDDADSTADGGSNEDVPSEMARARSDGEFEAADVVEAEDFFSDSPGEPGESSPEGPTEMEQARQAGSFEVAPIAAAEDFFGGESSSDSSSDAGVKEEKAEERSQTAGPPKRTVESKESLPVTPLPASKKASSRTTSTSRKKKKRHKRDASRLEALEAKQQTKARSARTGNQSAQSEHTPNSKLSNRSSSVKESPGNLKTASSTEVRPRTRRRSQSPSPETVTGTTAGTTQQKVSNAKPRTSSKSVAAVAPVAISPNRNAIVVTAAAVLLIGGLFMINAISKQGPEVVDTPRPQMTAVSPIAPPPLSEELERQADQLKNQAATLSGSRRISKQRELIALYAQERRFDLAAVVQQEIAEALNSEVEWVRSGNYFYDWMETQTGATKTDYAKLAIASYQRALDINPDNLDVRTNMALAYLYDPSNPMQAIRNTNLVLEKDPDHILANFNRGVMLMQINRLDQALEQFERVQTLVGDSNSPVYQRAENAIQTLRQHRNQ